MLASAFAWLAAAVVAHQLSAPQSVWALLIGGMFIFPFGLLITKLFGRSGQHRKDNPLGALALESTFLLLLALPIAYVVSVYRVAWFFPAMLLLIGGRYLLFATLYGCRWYWLLGAVLAICAWLLVFLKATPFAGALLGGVIECVFAVLLFRLER